MTLAEKTLWIIDTYENGKKGKFAEKTGISTSYVTRLLHDPSCSPSERVVNDICNAYGLSCDWYLRDIGEPHGPIDRAKEIAHIVNQALSRSPDEERQKLIDILVRADDAHIVLLAQVLNDIFGTIPPEE